jgi:diadenosine tetraphosphate (Ap4A) HIT family hydrolase
MKEVFRSRLGAVAFASGGTRRDMRLDRPWQTEIVYAPDRCPFENIADRESPISALEGWLVVRNQFTPFPVHSLVIPRTCWPPEVVRGLGGLSGIRTALRCVREHLGPGTEERWVGVHVGPLAGQNQAHLHYHVLRPWASPTMQAAEDIYAYCAHSDLVLFQVEPLVAAVGGWRAGQCLIASPGGALAFDDTVLSALSLTLHDVVIRANERLRSSQGLSPDYLIAMRFRGHELLYAFYMPVLNQWGFTEQLGILEASDLILPWAHRDTFELLRVMPQHGA